MKTIKSISFYTLGCRLNQSETAVMKNLFSRNSGYGVTDPGMPSDIAVINSCTVTENSDRDARKIVNCIIRLNPKTQIAFVGCQAQVQKREVSRLPNVRWVIGTAKKMDIVSILDENSKRLIAPSIKRNTFTVPAAGIDRHHTRANLKIQDGCDSYCTFCEVPYARGPARSRRFSDIIKEATVLVENGYKEIVLTGIHIGTYLQNTKTIIDVINALEDIEGLERIRISSIEPTSILDKLLLKMTKRSKLCRHFHLPIQSANDQILKMMGRKYAADKMMRFIEKAVELVPDICIGSDLIVGFPGETDDCFNDTYKRLLSSPIHYFHVFSFSPRKMAKAKNLPGKVDITVIQERSKILRELGQKKRDNFYKSQLGKIYAVLFEQKKKGYWTGLTDNFLHVKIKSKQRLHNKIINVKLTKVINQEIAGEIVK